MTDHRWNSDLEADNSVDWSSMNSRLNSFRGSGLAQQLSAERLARAGFYFTGQADRVRCFSCQKTVENWCGEDAPVERHIEVSPSCTFLSCTHRLRHSSGPDASLSNGSYNEAAEDMEFRLRRGEVVDESPYPMAPHMTSEDARLQTFTTWPSSAAVRPRDLAQAGLFYLGAMDRVQCFCCGGTLANWEVGDTAWGEHSKHFPRCFFILGHDVGNIPSLGSALVEDGERRQPSLSVQMSSFEQRLNSFTGIQHPIDHVRLATAGFYSAGPGDKVMCFHCGGGLKGWQPQEDPWEEHAKHYPGCGFLLAEKGQEFISSIQLQDPRRDSATSSNNGFATHQRGPEVLQSSMAQKAIGMGLDPTTVERAILEKFRRTGLSYPSLEELLEDCLKKIPETNNVNSEEQEGDPLEKLRMLQREKQCKVCMDRDICIVFIPCGHLVTCTECSQSLTKCPICCGAISQKIKTYIS